MTTSQKMREQDLPQLAGAAVDRALAARQTLAELSAEEADLVGGAVGGAVSMAPVLRQVPTLSIKPGDWAGPLLAPIGQQFQTPQINAGGMLRGF